MAQPIMVNQSTTLIQIDTSVLANSPHIVLLSNVNSPGSMITIRDTTGNAGQTNTVIVSTTIGVSYLDGGGPHNNIYTINQPYGYLTVTPKTPNIWGVINSFAFPDASASANLNIINVSSINISTIGYIQHALISTASISTLCTNNVYITDNLSVGQSTIAHAGFYVCTIRSLHDIIASSNIYAGSTMSSLFGNFTSTLTVPYISTTDVWINGGLKTTSSISTSGPMFVGSSISTTGNLAVGASTFIQGQLTVLQAAFFRSSISTTGALNVGYEAILRSSLQVTHNSFLGGNVSTMSNVTVGASLSVMSSLFTRWDMYTTSSILAVGSFSTLQDVNIIRNLSTLGKAFIGQELYTTSSILITGSFSTLQDVNVIRDINVGRNINVFSDINVLGTATIKNINVSQSGTTSLSGTLGVANTATFSNAINTVAAGAQNRMSNDTWMQTLKVEGNVGIGTTTPIARLDILGGNSSGGTGGSNLIAFQFNGGGFRHFITSRHDGSANVSTNSIDFWLNNVNTANGSSSAGIGNKHMMSITGAGVGINTNVPLATLHVANDVPYSAITGGTNPYNYAQVQISQKSNGARLYLGNAYTGGAGVASIIQSSDYYSNAEHGTNLLLNPLSGNVGIGTNAPAHALHVSGNIYASGNVTAYSDMRAKENITTIDSALDKVMALRGVYYTRKDIVGPRQVGVIAQEVEEILPEVVITDSEGKKSVAYGNIVALLIEGMKQQQSTIEALLSRI